MKIKYVLMFVFCLSFGFAIGQDLKVTNTGVGINTPSPTKALEVTSADFFVLQANGNGGIARLGIDHLVGHNSGIGINTLGTRRYSLAAFQAGTGNIDFTFWNDQTGSQALGLDGDTNNASFSGTVSSQGSLLTSDIRLKNNIQRYGKGLQTVLRINPIIFSYNKKINRSMTDRAFIGVSAQELQKLEPSLVSSFVHYEVDENMIPTGEKTEYLQVQSDALQYLLVNAIKEQQKIISKLEKRLRVLEGKN